jgi:2-oxoglutarate dehydrogenase E2 component (dihydrolipoamide succinyltransferase)
MADETWVVTMPKLGETVTEGTIGSWLKDVGDTVEFDDPLFEVSTDKVDSEIPSPYDGVILQIMVAAGETVPIGTELVRIGAPGSTPGAAPAAPAASDAGSPPASASEPPAAAGRPAAEAEGAAHIVHDITMPKLGETVAEGTIGSWLKNVGDTVEFDDPLMEVSTDKVDSEIPSPYDGVLVEILVQAGETVPIGTVVARIGEPGSAPTDSATPATPAAPAPVAPAAPGAGAPVAAAGGPAGRQYSPIVRRLAAENGIDLATLPGSGAGGRIRREDVEAAIAGRPAAAASVAPPVAPAAGPAPAAAPSASTAKPAASAAGDPRDQVVTLSRMRLAVAAGMVASVQAAPQVWTSIEVDYEHVEQIRRKHKEKFKAETGASLSYLPFISRAVCDALRKFPAVNSSIDIANKTMTFHPYVNLGIAVDMNEEGLIVPVVRDADQLNIRGIATQIKKMADAGRNKKLGAEDMRGSTFTITNPGPVQSYASAPIINQPNSAILCTDGVARKPVAVGDAIAIHHVGVVGLVYDHRAFDGVTASKFLMAVRDAIENRDWVSEIG